MQTKHPELNPQPPPLLGSHSLGHYPCNHPGVRYQKTKESPYALGLLKLLKLVNPKPAYTNSPIPSVETTIEVLITVSPSVSPSLEPLK